MPAHDSTPGSRPPCVCLSGEAAIPCQEEDDDRQPSRRSSPLVTPLGYGGAVLKWLRFSSDNLLIALAVWMCTLPLLALIVVPRFGLSVAGGAALLSLVVAVVVCCWVLRPKVGPR